MGRYSSYQWKPGNIWRHTTWCAGPISVVWQCKLGGVKCHATLWIHVVWEKTSTCNCGKKSLNCWHINFEDYKVCVCVYVCEVYEVMTVTLSMLAMYVMSFWPKFTYFPFHSLYRLIDIYKLAVNWCKILFRHRKTDVQFSACTESSKSFIQFLNAKFVMFVEEASQCYSPVQLLLWFI